MTTAPEIRKFDMNTSVLLYMFYCLKTETGKDFKFNKISSPTSVIIYSLLKYFRRKKFICDRIAELNRDDIMDVPIGNIQVHSHLF